MMMTGPVCCMLQEHDNNDNNNKLNYYLILLILIGANLLDQLLKLIDTVDLGDDDWTRVLRVTGA